MSGSVFLVQLGWVHNGQNFPKFDKFDKFDNIYAINKAAVVLNFCLIGKIRHNFLVPIMIESVRKTFMPVQTFNLHRVYSVSGGKSFMFQSGRKVNW